MEITTMQVGQFVRCPSLGVGHVVESIPDGRVLVAFDHAVDEDGRVGTRSVLRPEELRPISEHEARARVYLTD